MSGGPRPAVTVTVVLHNSEVGLTACLRAIHRDMQTGLANLVVVDNASPDSSAQIVMREAPYATLVRSEENLGFAAGVNLAWPHVLGRYWMLLNPDTVVADQGLARLVEWMDRHPRIGIASPEIVSADGIPSSAGRALPSILRSACELTRLHRLLPAPMRARLLRGSYWLGGDQFDTGWVPGTAMIARHETVAEIGTLDARMFMYGEDLEWCWRARRAGWRIGVCSAVIVVHAGATSACRTWDADEALQRMATGVFDAVQRVRGGAYARCYMRIEGLSLRLESLHPRRSPELRARSRTLSRAWLCAARGGAPTAPSAAADP